MQEGISRWIALTGAPAFARIHRFDRVLRRKLTTAGWMLAGVLVASAAFGLNTRETLAYQLFGLAAALALVALAASARLGVRFAAERRLPRVATAGRAFEYTLAIQNLDDRRHEGLWIEDTLRLPATDRHEFAAYKVAQDRSRNVFDRLVGYPRWLGYVHAKTGGRIEPRRLEALEARATVEVRMRCEPLRRGVLRFAGVGLGREEPLGLMKSRAWSAREETLVVLPRTHSVAALRLAGTRRLQPGGIAFAGRVGDAEEFVSLRDYRPGDTPRRIHWKAWARTGRPVVKEYQDEFFVRHALVLDSFGQGDDACFEAAVSLAASLVVMPRSSESLLDLMFVEGRAYTMTQGRGLGGAGELLRILATVSCTRAGSFTQLADAVALGAGRMSGAICVLLDWDPVRQAMVAALRARGIPLRVWVVAPEARTLDPGPMVATPGELRLATPATLAAELLKP